MNYEQFKTKLIQCGVEYKALVEFKPHMNGSALFINGTMMTTFSEKLIKRLISWNTFYGHYSEVLENDEIN